MGQYFSSKGIRISITNLSAFVNVLDDAFVRHEALSGLVGRLSNYDIRRMLLLAQQTITSASFQVEDLVKAYVDRGMRAFNFKRALRALILRDYDRYTDQTNDFVMNIFATDGQRPFSPLLSMYVLEVLANAKRQAGDDISRRYWTLSEVVNYFEPLGASPEDVIAVVREMLAFRLLEPFEPSNEGLRNYPFGGGSSRVALDEEVYLEQMALVTGYRYENVQQSILELSRNMGLSENRDGIRQSFVDYTIREDKAKLTLPASSVYASLQAISRDFSGVVERIAG